MAAGGAAMASSAGGNKKGGQLRSISILSLTNTTGENNTPILPMLRHAT
jgi:hypothetical protein